MKAATEMRLRGELTLEEPMSRHTSWGVGGPARRFYRPRDLADLAEFLRTLPADEPLLWVGLGSNLLVRDGGVRATVIATHGRLERIEAVDRSGVRLESGVTCAKAARHCTRAGLRGVEFLAGIPGTIGGALAMNAGCYGGETWQWVERVETIDRAGHIRLRPPSDFAVGYRAVQGPEGEWFVAARLRLQPGDPQQGLALVRTLLARRNASQPTDQRSCGSVFRNPGDGRFAAQLIESAGLKGTCIGSACVSHKHANFILNTGDATAAQIEALIELVAERVEQIHGVRLVPEVRVLGEP